MYYDLTADGWVVDDATGSSNQTNFSHRLMIDLVKDSLAYWHEVMGVDGFRFDLATVLGRYPGASDKEAWGGRRRFYKAHPLLREVADYADQRDIEVIAEAWDLWGYEVGNFPSGWGEWNGRYRDTMSHYMKGDGNTRNFMDLLIGDWLHFNDNAGPQKSINFLTAHDGFTMFDLVSFNEGQHQESPVRAVGRRYRRQRLLGFRRQQGTPAGQMAQQLADRDDVPRSADGGQR